MAVKKKTKKELNEELEVLLKRVYDLENIVRKRKRKASIRSRRQCGVITNIPPERQNSTRRVKAKYLL